MRITSFLLLILVTTFSQAQVNMTLLGQLDYQTLHSSSLSDIWGYVDEEDNEYALVGVNNGGLSVVDVTDPANPNEVFFAPGPNSIWRDIKTWGDYAYVTTEGGGGVVIVDLSPLPQSTNLTFSAYRASGVIDAVHNLYIDENGIMYLFGNNGAIASGGNGVILLDLNIDPVNPPVIADYSPHYSHDGVARGDTMYLAHIYEGEFAVVDITDPNNPVELGTHVTPNNFAHNIWFSDDRDYVFTTDERSSGYIGAFDISDLNNIEETDRIQSNSGSGVIPHNTHFINDYIVTSYYRDGVTIHDVSNPHNIVEVGNYDTSPLFGNGFNGCWGAYPYLPSGNILASDIEGGLFIFAPNYVRGCYIEGNVIDNATSFALGNVDIQILGTTTQTEFTDPTGSYATGVSTSGTYDIAFHKAGYERDTVYNVSVTNGVVTTADAQLVPLIPFTLGGVVRENGTTNGIDAAQVVVNGEDFQYTTTTDEMGNFSIPNFYEGIYDITIGQWGYVTDCIEGFEILPSTTNLDLDLEVGYYDDFSLDFSWGITGNAADGEWERGIPDETAFQGTIANPGSDVQDDCYGYAYVTGIFGGNGHNNDLDNGVTILTSPPFDGTSAEFVSFYRWFANYNSNQSFANDTLFISLEANGNKAIIDTVTVEDVMHEWVITTRRISDYIIPSTNMKIQFLVADEESAGENVLEAGIDLFRLTALNLDETGGQTDLKAYPNPFNNQLNILVSGAPTNEYVTVKLFDISGKLVLVQQTQVNAEKITLNAENQLPGFYLVEVSDNKEKLGTVRVVKF